MPTTPQDPAPGQDEGRADPGESADPTAALEQSVGVEIGMSEEGSTFEPEEDPEG